MENQPYYNRSEGSKDKSDGKSREPAADFGYTNVYQTPSERSVPEAPAQVERHIPLAPAFEGIISWRDDFSAEQPAPEKEAKDKDKEKDKKEGEKGEKQPTLPGATEEQPKRPIFPEFQPPQPEQTAEDETTDQEDEDAAFDLPTQQLPPIPVTADQYPRYSNVYESPAEQQPDQRVVASPLQPVAQNHFNNPAQTEQVMPPQMPNQGEFAPMQSDYSNEVGDQQPEPPIPTMPISPNAAAFMRPTSEQQPWPGPSEAAAEQPDTIPRPADYYQGEQSAQPTPDQSGETPSYSPLQPESTAAYPFDHDPYLNPAQAPERTTSGVPPMPIEHPQFNNNRDPRVGPVAALLGLEYIGRKRADRKLERKMNNQIENTAKEQERRTTAEHQRLQEQQRQFATEQQWQSAEMQKTQQAPAQSQERYAAPAAPTTYETPGQFQPQSFETPQPLRTNPGARIEQPRPMGPEARPAVPVNAVAAEQQAQAAAEQPYELKPNQHVEHSAWHNIVVDDRGHEVAGAINYGEGFQRERQQELRQDPPTDQGGAYTGSVNATGQSQAPQFGMPYPGALPSGMTSPSLPQGQPTHADSQHQLEARNDKKQASNFGSPWFWIMILLVIAAFFTAAAV